MIITVYRPLSEETPTFAEAKVTDITIIQKYEYRKSMTDVGSFSLTIPSNVSGAELIEVGMILHVDFEDSLIIRNIVETETGYEIEGKDLKDLLNRRVTVFPTDEWEDGTYGHDVVSGSTEECIKHYVDYNIANPENIKRKIYGFVCKNNANRGISNDSYMSRLDPLNEVVEELCKNSGLGYDILIDTKDNSYIFDVFEPVDKTDSNGVDGKVVFAVEFKNIHSLSYNRGDVSERNTIFVVNDGAKAYVQQINLSDDESIGIGRKEVSANVSCELEDIELYAKKAAEGMIKNNSFEMEAGNISDYGNMYTLGDRVTFKYKNLFLDSVIVEVVKEFVSGAARIKLITGDKEPKLINGMKTRITTTKTDLKESLLNKADNAPPIGSIEIKGDGHFVINTKYGTEEYKAGT